MVFLIFLHPQEKIKPFRVILRRRMKEIFMVCFPQDGMSKMVGKDLETQSRLNFQLGIPVTLRLTAFRISFS